jgi:hypothetical protein
MWLSRMLQAAKEAGTIHGLLIPPIQEQGLHSLYAEDVSIVIRAQITFILQLMLILEAFVKALGFYVNWQKTRAAFTSDAPLPSNAIL